MSLPLAACSMLGVEADGATCGGDQFASAHISLPDTGISAGSELLFVLVQRDPYLIGEQTDISIQEIPAPAARADILPLVRLVHDDGRVLLDQPSSPASTGETWRVIYTTHSTEVRNPIFDGLRTQSISLQLLREPSGQPGTTVRLPVGELGVSPVERCL